MIRLSKMNLYQLLGFMFIMIPVLWVYGPALFHCARADQMVYLAEVADKTSFNDLVFNTYNLNRHRMFSPGDEILFRPLLYVLLGLETYLFRYLFIAWQAVGVCLHLGVVWYLLRLLLTISLSPWAIMIASFFALAAMNMEMVIWHHIHAYMLALIFMLIAIRHLILFLQKCGYLARYHIWFCATMMTLACLTYEVNVAFVLCMIIGILLYRPNRFKQLSPLFLSVFIYFGFSLIDAWINPTVISEVPHLLSKPIHMTDLARDVFWSLSFWIHTSIFPWQMPIDLMARNVFPLTSISNLFTFQLSSLASWSALLILIFFMGALFRFPARDRGWWVMTILLMMVSFAVIILLGRGYSRGIWDVLRVDLYYFYPVILLFVCALYASIAWEQLSKRPWFLAVLPLSIIFLFSQGQLVYQLNWKQATSNKPVIDLFHTLDELIKMRSQEPQFSFYVDPRYPGNYIYPQIQHKDNPQRLYTITEALYPQWSRPRSVAKYSFVIKE